MKTFTTLNITSKIKNDKTNEVVIISKIQKDGTKRTFYKLESKDTLITKTFFARLYDAESTAKRYLNRI